MDTPPTRRSAGAEPDRETLLALLDASRSINAELEPAEVCRLVACHARAVLRTQAASVLLLDKTRNELVFQTVIDPHASDVIEGQRFPADQGIAGQVVRTRRSIRIDDVRENRHFYPGIDLLTQSRTRNLMAVPLVHRDSVLGVVEVINREQGEAPFTEEDLALLELFANLVAGAASNAQRFANMNREIRGLRESMPRAQFIGAAPTFQRALDLCAKVAHGATTVLLTGETGTGKEMAARAICAMSPRADGPFVAVNCAALPEALIESELFGHEAGAFTGATSRRAGKLELAHGGPLLLDEIGELDLAMQAKLLRVLESGEFTRVGGGETILCDVRVIAATNRDLRAEAEAGRFRDDLFYRLNVFPIALPPLRERRADLPLLIEHLVAQVLPSLNVSRVTVSDEAMACIRRYAWPGNVRELRNVLERAVLLTDGDIRPEHLPPEIAGATADGDGGDDQDRAPASALAEQEEKMVLRALEANDWNQSAAARELGITRAILRYRMKRYRLRRPGAREPG